MKRICVGFSTIVLAALLLAACQSEKTPDVSGGGESDVATVVPQTETSPVPSGPVTVFSRTSHAFSLMRPDTANSDEIIAINAAVTEHFGRGAKLGTDYTAPGREIDNASCEVLIGHTNREASAAALDGLKYDEFALKMIGNKLCLLGLNDQTMQAACDYFIGLIAEAGEALTLDAGYSYVGRLESLGWPTETVPLYRGGEMVSLLDSGNHSFAAHYKNTSADEYAAYCKTLEGQGYTEVMENVVGPSRFDIYSDGKALVYLHYSEGEQVTRLVVEEDRDLSAVSYKTDKVRVESTLTQVASAPLTTNRDPLHPLGDRDYCCNILQMEDGSFIIYDSGLDDETDNAATIYDFLMAHKPADHEKPKIAAWVISHPHADHIGGIIAFGRKYGDKVDARYLMCKIPGGTQCVSWAKSDNPDLNAAVQWDQHTAWAKAIGAEVFTLRAGQHFTFSNCEMDVLYTYDEYAPCQTADDGNNFSCAIRFTMKGQSILLVGDGQDDVAKVMVKMYGDALKSDFCQVAHHGHVGYTTAAYHKISPSYLLWDTTTSFFVNQRKREANAYLIDRLRDGTIRGMFVCGEGSVTLTLPYEPVEERPGSQLYLKDLDVEWGKIQAQYYANGGK